MNNNGIFVVLMINEGTHQEIFKKEGGNSQ